MINQIDEIVRALLSVQDIEPPEARRLASDVVVNEVALGVASIWVAQGEFPDAPSVAGLTPATLSKDFLPSQVLSVTLWLQTDPRKALDWVHGALARKARLARHAHQSKPNSP